MLSPVNMLLRGSLKLSLIFLSSPVATISAALPLGQRMTGIEPEGDGWSEVGEDMLTIPTSSNKHGEERLHNRVTDALYIHILSVSAVQS